MQQQRHLKLALQEGCIWVLLGCAAGSLHQFMHFWVAPLIELQLGAASATAGSQLSRCAAGRLHQHVDFVVCLGGDGTILHASSLFQWAIPPVISFSAGSLGFLTNHSLANVESDLKAVIYGSEDLDQCSLEEEVRPVSLARIRVFGGRQDAACSRVVKAASQHPNLGQTNLAVP